MPPPPTKDETFAEAQKQQQTLTKIYNSVKNGLKYLKSSLKNEPSDEYTDNEEQFNARKKYVSVTLKKELAQQIGEQELNMVSSVNIDDKSEVLVEKLIIFSKKIDALLHMQREFSVAYMDFCVEFGITGKMVSAFLFDTVDKAEVVNKVVNATYKKPWKKFFIFMELCVIFSTSMSEFVPFFNLANTIFNADETIAGEFLENFVTQLEEINRQLQGVRLVEPATKTSALRYLLIYPGVLNADGSLKKTSYKNNLLNVCKHLCLDDEPDALGMTSLHWAMFYYARNNSPHLLDFIEILMQNPKTALNGSVGMLKDPFVFNGFTSTYKLPPRASALHFAVATEKIELVRLFCLDKKVNLKHKALYQETAAQYADRLASLYVLPTKTETMRTIAKQLRDSISTRDDELGARGERRLAVAGRKFTGLEEKKKERFDCCCRLLSKCRDVSSMEAYCTSEKYTTQREKWSTKFKKLVDKKEKVIGKINSSRLDEPMRFEEGLDDAVKILRVDSNIKDLKAMTHELGIATMNFCLTFGVYDYFEPDFQNDEEKKAALHKLLKMKSSAYKPAKLIMYHTLKDWFLSTNQRTKVIDHVFYRFKHAEALSKEEMRGIIDAHKDLLRDPHLEPLTQSSILHFVLLKDATDSYQKNVLLFLKCLFERQIIDPNSLNVLQLTPLCDTMYKMKNSPSEAQIVERLKMLLEYPQTDVTQALGVLNDPANFNLTSIILPLDAKSTPLHFAVAIPSLSSVQLLCQLPRFAFALQTQSKSGDTALAYAIDLEEKCTNESVKKELHSIVQTIQEAIQTRQEEYEATTTPVRPAKAAAVYLKPEDLRSIRLIVIDNDQIFLNVYGDFVRHLPNGNHEKLVPRNDRDTVAWEWIDEENNSTNGRISLNRDGSPNTYIKTFPDRAAETFGVEFVRDEGDRRYQDAVATHNSREKPESPDRIPAARSPIVAAGGSKPPAPPAPEPEPEPYVLYAICGREDDPVKINTDSPANFADDIERLGLAENQIKKRKQQWWTTFKKELQTRDDNNTYQSIPFDKLFHEADAAKVKTAFAALLRIDETEIETTNFFKIGIDQQRFLMLQLAKPGQYAIWGTMHHVLTKGLDYQYTNVAASVQGLLKTTNATRNLISLQAAFIDGGL